MHIQIKIKGIPHPVTRYTIVFFYICIIPVVRCMDYKNTIATTRSSTKGKYHGRLSFWWKRKKKS